MHDVSDKNAEFEMHHTHELDDIGVRGDDARRHAAHVSDTVGTAAHVQTTHGRKRHNRAECPGTRTPWKVDCAAMATTAAESAVPPAAAVGARTIASLAFGMPALACCC